MVAGLVWIAIMTYICYRGIEISARPQAALLSIEIVTLIIFAVVALAKVYGGDAGAGSVHPQLSWLWPGGLSISHVIAPAVLVAVFIFWGWDTAVATNEESHRAADRLLLRADRHRLRLILPQDTPDLGATPPRPRNSAHGRRTLPLRDVRLFGKDVCRV